MVMLAYSIISGLSFENLSDWLREVRIQCSPDVMVFLVGNKCDMEMLREVSIESVLEFKEMNKINYFQETSAKSGKNVETLFSDCSRLLYHKYKDKMNSIDNVGDLSNNDESFTSQDERYKDSGGHRVGRNKGRKLR